MCQVRQNEKTNKMKWADKRKRNQSSNVLFSNFLQECQKNPVYTETQKDRVKKSRDKKNTRSHPFGL
jgi:hypothetical protein